MADDARDNDVLIIIKEDSLILRDMFERFENTLHASCLTEY